MEAHEPLDPMPLPTLDERANSICGRHGERRFTNEEYSGARRFDVRAMAMTSLQDPIVVP